MSADKKCRKPANCSLAALQRPANVVRQCPLWAYAGRQIAIVIFGHSSLAMRELLTRQSDWGNILWSVLWLLVPLSGSILQKDTAYSTAKRRQGRVRDISLRLSVWV